MSHALTRTEFGIIAGFMDLCAEEIHRPGRRKPLDYALDYRDGMYIRISGVDGGIKMQISQRPGA